VIENPAGRFGGGFASVAPLSINNHQSSINN
jgi:hypothetical protein